MTTELILREEKGSPLTHEELDNNLNQINTKTNKKLGIDNMLHVEDRKPAGTHGGTFTSGAWRTRDLNTIVTNNINGASLSNNQVTLPAGEYWVEAESSAYRVARNGNRLYNVSLASVLLIGLPRQSHANYGPNDTSFLTGRLILDNITVLEIQHTCATTLTTTGFGNAVDLGSSHETYSTLKIWKVG